MAWFISKEFLEKQLRDSLNWILMPTTAQSYQVSPLPLWHSFPALPKSQIIVLIAAYKVACSATHFNFESVLQKYKSYMASHISQFKNIQQLNKQTFIKIFLDLTDKGFLKSESDTDILSVNNKIALGFRLKDLEEVLRQKLHLLDLPEAIKNWINIWYSLIKYRLLLHN